MMYTRTISLIAFFLCTTLSADVISGSSSGTGLDIDVTALSLVTLNAGPFAASSGSAPSTYSETDSVASVSASTLLLADANTGLISTSASSNIDGSSGIKNATGSSIVNGLTLDLLPVVIGSDLLNISATTIGSTSTSSGDYGSLGSVGTSVFEDLYITVNGNSITADLDASPEANSWVYVGAGSLLGLEIHLNEQITSGDSTYSSITTNAIRISLNPLNVGTLGVQGDIIIGQSESIIVVPELSTLGLSSLALLATFGICIRRKRQRSHILN